MGHSEDRAVRCLAVIRAPEGADVVGNDIEVDYDKDIIKDAPRVDADGDLTPEEEQRLYDHYGLTRASGRARSSSYTAGDVGYDRDRDTVGYDTSGPTTDDAMTRSEERLNVGTRSRKPAGRDCESTLRRRTSRRRFRSAARRSGWNVSRSPMTTGAARSGPDISEEEHEVVLREERPVVEKEAVPVERVRLGTETVTDQRRFPNRSARNRSTPTSATAGPTADLMGEAATLQLSS